MPSQAPKTPARANDGPGRPPGRGDDAAGRRFDPVRWGILAAVLAVWLIETGGGLWRTSHWCHYVYLADAFNHGQFHLFHHPTDAGDMAIIGDRAYVVFGPLPAVLLMPLVAWLGPSTPDVLVLVVTALFAIYAFDRLLLAVHGARDRFALACTTLSFALGTAIHYGVPMGNVWLHAQISATALQCWALWMGAEGRAGWSGAAYGLAVLTRPTVVLAAPLAAWLLVRPPAGNAVPSRMGIRATLLLGAPIVAAAALHGLYNWARFGNVFDAGYHDIWMGDEFKALVDTYGRFNLHFLWTNSAGWLFRLPRWDGGALAPDPHGMSLLLSVPFLWILATPRRPAALEWVALGTCALIAVPALLYYNDGWVQFGQRFALDWLAPALLACSAAARRAPAWVVGALALVGVIVNAWGMQWFQANFLH